MRMVQYGKNKGNDEDSYILCNAEEDELSDDGGDCERTFSDDDDDTNVKKQVVASLLTKVVPEHKPVPTVFKGIHVGIRF